MAHNKYLHWLPLHAVMILAGLWWLWTKLPDWFQELIRALWKRRENKDDET